MYDYRPARMRRFLAFIADMNVFALLVFLLMGITLLIPEEGFAFVGVLPSSPALLPCTSGTGC